MLVTLIPQLTKHTVLLMPVALHLRAICQLLVITDGIANGACHIVCVSFMDRALGEELWKPEMQIHEYCLTLGIIQGTNDSNKRSLSAQVFPQPSFQGELCFHVCRKLVFVSQGKSLRGFPGQSGNQARGHLLIVSACKRFSEVFLLRCETVFRGKREISQRFSFQGFAPRIVLGFYLGSSPRTRPGKDQDRARTGSGQGQDRVRTGSEQGQDRITPGVSGLLFQGQGSNTCFEQGGPTPH